MKPITAYTIAICSSAVVAGGVTWLVNTHEVRSAWAPLVSAAFGAFLGAYTVGNALRGSTSYIAEERAPLSSRRRWIYGAIGAVLVIVFALVLPAMYAHTAR